MSQRPPGDPPDPIDERARAVRNLRRMASARSQLFARVAVTLSRVAFDEIDGEIERALQVVGREIGASAMTVFTRTDDVLRIASHWCSTASWMDPPPELPLSKATYLRAELAAGREIIADVLTDLPLGAQYERAVLGARKTASLAALPLSHDGGEGMLLAEALGEPISWDRQCLALLEIFADAIAGTLERKRHQAELVAARTHAEADAARQARLMATLAHELRAPLTGIVGCAQLLCQDDDNLSDQQRSYARDILASARHLAGVVTDSLSLARIETGRAPVTVSSFDPVELMTDALRHVRHLADERGVTLVAEMPPHGDRATGDRGKLTQLATNLLNNAVKFTAAGGKVIARVALRVSDYDLEISDTGIGIAPRDRERIFDAFRQVEGASEEGAGLGLALVKRIASLHRGTVSVDSEPGRGSTFRVTLPRDPGLEPSGRQPYLGGLLQSAEDDDE